MPDTSSDTSVTPQAPIEVPATLTKTQVIFVIGQFVAALAAVVGFLGLGETTWIVRAVRFLQSNDAVPVTSLIAWAVVAGALWYRNRRRAIERAVMAAMVSNKVAVLKGEPVPAVKAAIDNAVAAKFSTVAEKVKGL